MKAEPEFDLLRFTADLERARVRYLLIGRWAVAYYGSPVVTADHDFWIHPADRKKVLALIEAAGGELPTESERTRPLATLYVGSDRIDLFSLRRIGNREGEVLEFETVYGRSRRIRDLKTEVDIRLPSIDDLIALKKFDSPDPLKHARNLEDIRFLETLKRQAKRKRGRAAASRRRRS